MFRKGSHSRSKTKKIKLKKNAWIAFGVALVLVIVGGFYLVFSDEEEVVEPPEEEEEEIVEDEEKEEEEIADVFRCEYCGAPIDKDHEALMRPIAVTWGNSSNERPQSGLNSACVVYEVPAEGNTTRLVGIFYKPYSGDLGPIRSARFYTVTLALEHDALYVHVGGYQPVMNKISEYRAASINEFRDGGAFWRSQDRVRPYNAYTTVENVLEAAEARGYRDEGDRNTFSAFVDHPGIDEDGREVAIPVSGDGSNADKANQITINNYGKRIEYQYNEDLYGYERFVNGEQHYDAEDEEPVLASDVIIQFVNARVIDDVGRLRLGMVGEGEGMYLAGGKKIPVKWEKESQREPTEFYLKETGEPLEVLPGQTWVNLTPTNINVTYDQIEEPKEDTE